MSDFKLWITHRESFNFNQETHIFLQVPSIDYSRSVGSHRGNFGLIKGWPHFLAKPVYLLPIRECNLQDCVWGKSLFWLKIENFRYSEKKKKQQQQKKQTNKNKQNKTKQNKKTNKQKTNKKKNNNKNNNNKKQNKQTKKQTNKKKKKKKTHTKKKQQQQKTSFWGEKSFFRNSYFSQHLLGWQSSRQWHFGSWTYC